MVHGIDADLRRVAIDDVVPGLGKARCEGRVLDLVIEPTAFDPASLDAISGEQSFLVVENGLQWIADYRGFLRRVHERLAVGGQLVLSVPHQFLHERKYRLPSRYDAQPLRFYTPATLTAEIEEALDPTQYRLRLLKDDDAGYDYACPIRQRPEGAQRIVAVIERLARPVWASQLHDGDDVCVERAEDSRIVALESAPVVTHVLAPAHGDVRRILVLKLDHRGDFLMARLAFERLRARFPQAHITCVCGPWNAGVAEESGLFDAVIGFGFFAEDASLKNEPDRDENIAHFAALMEGKSFDLAIDMRFYEDTRGLLQGVAARHKAGFDSWAQFGWLDIRLNLPVPTVDGRAEQDHWPVSRFSCAEGDRQDKVMVCRPAPVLGRRKAALWGPYAGLGKGRYELQMDFNTWGRNARVKLDIVCHAAQTTLFSGDVEALPGRLSSLEFALAERAEDVELRIFRPGPFDKRFDFRGARVWRAGVAVGTHQQESMVLLVELVGMRMHSAWQDRAQVMPA
jgi:hypothetical protein